MQGMHSRDAASLAGAEAERTNQASVGPFSCASGRPLIQPSEHGASTVETKQAERISQAEVETEVSTLAAISEASSDLLMDNPSWTEMAMKQRLERRRQLLKICLELTSPGQWVVFRGEDGKGCSCYPTGGASDAIIRHILACTWADKSYVIENDVNGAPIACEYSATLISRDGRPIERFTGYRSIGGYTSNKQDLIAGASENCKSRALRDLLGLRGRTPEELAELGLDLKKVGTATFNDNRQGPDAVPSFKFGRCSGKSFNDPSVSMTDLQWYLKRSDEALSDPDKAKYRKSETRQNAALKSEIERRSKPAAPVQQPPPKLTADQQIVVDQWGIKFNEEAQTEKTLQKMGDEVGKLAPEIREALKPAYGKRLDAIRAAAKAEPGSAG